MKGSRGESVVCFSFPWDTRTEVCRSRMWRTITQLLKSRRKHSDLSGKFSLLSGVTYRMIVNSILKGAGPLPRLTHEFIMTAQFTPLTWHFRSETSSYLIELCWLRAMLLEKMPAIRRHGKVRKHLQPIWEYRKGLNRSQEEVNLNATALLLFL